jgi:hypothetical protein
MNVYVHEQFMVRVFSEGGVSVYVYVETNQPHKLPHRQVRFSDGSNSQVALPTLSLLAGRSVPRAVRELLVLRLDEICNAWDHLNPERRVS